MSDSSSPNKPQIGVLGAEFFQLLFGMEVVDRFVVAVADLDQMPRQFVRLRVPMLDVIGEVAAVPAQGVGVLVQRFEQFQDFRQLLFA